MPSRSDNHLIPGYLPSQAHRLRSCSAPTRGSLTARASPWPARPAMWTGDRPVSRRRCRPRRGLAGQGDGVRSSSGAAGAGYPSPSSTSGSLGRVSRCRPARPPWPSGCCGQPGFAGPPRPATFLGVRNPDNHSSAARGSLSRIDPTVKPIRPRHALPGGGDPTPAPGRNQADPPGGYSERLWTLSVDNLPPVDKSRLADDCTPGDDLGFYELSRHLRGFRAPARNPQACGKLGCGSGLPEGCGSIAVAQAFRGRRSRLGRAPRRVPDPRSASRMYGHAWRRIHGWQASVLSTSAQGTGP